MPVLVYSGALVETGGVGVLNRRAPSAETWNAGATRRTPPEEVGVPTDLYTTERGEVLAWIQIVLTDEEQADLRVSTGGEREAPASLAAAADPSDAPTRSSLTDPATGAPTLQALRRDLAFHRWTPSEGAAEPVLLALELRPVGEIQAAGRPGVADAVLRTVIEVVPMVVESRTRWYRGLHDDVLLLLGEVDCSNPRAVLGRLAGAAGDMLSARGLPSIRLFARRLRVSGGLPAAS